MQIQASPKYIILNLGWIWYWLYLWNMVVGGERKVQWCHSIDKNVSWLREIHFPESTANTGKGHANKNVHRVLQTQQKEGDCFGALSVRLVFVFRTVSRYFTPTLVFKIRSYCIFKKLRGFWLFLHKSHQKPVIINRTIIFWINCCTVQLRI
jgi:hypothetical protein